MRKLMALAIVLVLAGTTRAWALFGLGDVTFDGSLEVSGNAANNEVDFGNVINSSATDHRGGTVTRVRVGMNAQVTEGVKARVEAARSGRQYGTGATTVTGEEALWSFQNAYVDVENFLEEGHMLRIGRQYVGNSGDLAWNISPKDNDNLTLNSIDGVLFQCRKYDFINLDLFMGKATEDDALANTNQDDLGATGATSAAGDVNLNSFDIVLPKLVPNSKLNVGYLWGQDTNTQATGDNNSLKTARVGINGGVSENLFTYRAEIFQNMGEFKGAGLTGAGAATKLKYQGSAIDLGVGLNPKETSAGSFGLWLNYLMASGDDNLADDKDKSFHDFSPLGVNTSDRLLGEIFGKSNTLGGGTPLGQGLNTADTTGSAPASGTQGAGLSVLNFGAQYKPKFAPRTWARVDFYTFARAEDSVSTGTTKINIGDKIGTELDFALGFNQSDNVTFELGYAMLSPDDALLLDKLASVSSVPVPSGTKDDAVTKLYARAKVKWGGEGK